MYNSIHHLIDFIARLPGLGPKSAKRIVLQMIRDKEKMMHEFASLLCNVADNIKMCARCNNIDINEICHICSNHNRDQTKLCIVEEIGDLWNIEKSGHFLGLYHVLSGLKSDRSAPYNIQLDSITEHLKAIPDLQEIIIANNSTVRGQTIMFYLSDALSSLVQGENREIKITAIGQGIPIGSELDYLDDGTIGAAFRTRSRINQEKEPLRSLNNPS